MVGFFVAWTAIVFTWIALAAIFAGLGLFLTRIFRFQASGMDLLGTIWLGYATAVLLLQLGHFVIPIGAWFTWTFILLATCGWFANRRSINTNLFAELRTIGPGWLILACLVTVWVANRAMGPNHEIDSHLYHIPTMEWYKDFPIVPGLSNLYLPLGSNSSSLLVAAWLDSGPWSGRAYHIANGFLIAGLFWHALSGIAVLHDDSNHRRALGWFKLASLIPATQMTNHWMVSGYSTDVAPAVLVLVAASDLFVLLITTPARQQREADEIAVVSHRAFRVAVLLSAALCCKMTALAFAALGILLAVWVLTRWHRKCQLPVAGTLCAGAIASLLLLLPWMARGVVLSGYPLYPSTTPSVAVDWRVPRGHVEAEKFYQMLRNRLRQFYDWGNEDAIRSLADWGWIRYWAENLERETILPTALFLLLIVAAVVLTKKKQRDWIRGLNRGWLLLVPTVAAIVFWFITQAEPRMGFFLFWVAASTALGIAGTRLLHNVSGRGVRTAVLATIVIAAANIKKTHTPPGEDFGMHRGMETPPMVAFETDWGLTVYRPAHGERLCSDAAKPATPTPMSELRLRKEGDLASGFRLEPRKPIGMGIVNVANEQTHGRQSVGLK